MDLLATHALCPAWPYWPKYLEVMTWRHTCKLTYIMIIQSWHHVSFHEVNCCRSLHEACYGLMTVWSWLHINWQICCDVVPFDRWHRMARMTRLAVWLKPTKLHLCKRRQQKQTRDMHAGHAYLHCPTDKHMCTPCKHSTIGWYTSSVPSTHQSQKCLFACFHDDTSELKFVWHKHLYN